MKLQEKERTRAEGRTCVLHAVRLAAFSRDSDSEESACSAGDRGSIPGLGRPPGEGNGYHSSILAWRISWTVAHQAPRSWNFPGKNTGVVCHFLLQGVFPTQGSNPCLLHWQADSFTTEPPGKSRKSSIYVCVCVCVYIYVCVCVCV